MKTTLVRPTVEKNSLDTQACDALILPIFENGEVPAVTKNVDQKTKGAIREYVNRWKFEGENGKSVWMDAPSGWECSRILILGLGKRAELKLTSVRDAYGAASNEAAAQKIKHVAIAYLDGKELAPLFIKALEGFLLGLYRFNKYKAKPEKDQSIQKVTVVSQAKASHLESDVEDLLIRLDATYFARDLVNEPANVVTPTYMEKAASAIAKETGLRIKVLHEQELRKKGMNLIIAVGMGSKERPRMVHLEYQPKAKAKRTVVLIGKGVCFDSGGLSLKPQDYMYGMKGDMAGAAAVLATMWAVSKLELNVHVHGLFPLVENLPSHESVKPGDVFIGHNGKSVEIENTDAEGRLILADALSYSKELNADETIDCATLTGAVVVALGEDIAGVMSPDDKIVNSILSASNRAGEIVWRLPMEPSYLKLLKSDVADFKNVAGRYGGAITAALFLAEFAPERWAHLDIAGPGLITHDWPTCVKGGTGFAVRTFLEYLSSATH